MKGELIKEEDLYGLKVEDKIIAVSDKDLSILANYPYKLSIKNCQEIELGYDLDELIENAYKKYDNCKLTLNEQIQRVGGFSVGYKLGFQKALELLGDKKYSEDELSTILVTFLNDIMNMKYRGNEISIINQLIQSLQQTEWDVEFNPDKKDSDGCLILKKV